MALVSQRQHIPEFPCATLSHLPTSQRRPPPCFPHRTVLSRAILPQPATLQRRPPPCFVAAAYDPGAVRHLVQWLPRPQEDPKKNDLAGLPLSWVDRRSKIGAFKIEYSYILYMSLPLHHSHLNELSARGLFVSLVGAAVTPALITPTVVALTGLRSNQAARDIATLIIATSTRLGSKAHAA